MTATELLLDQAARIREGIADLLERSSMTQMARDWGSAVWLGPTGEWGKLDVEGHRIQSRVLEEYGRFFETLRVVLKGLPPDGLQQLEESDEAIRKVVEQSELTWLRSVDAARTSALSALETQCELLDRLHDAGGGAASSSRTPTHFCTTSTSSGGPSPIATVSSSCLVRPSLSSWTNSRSTIETPTSARRRRASSHGSRAIARGGS
jgi:hypothetical protein